MGRVLDKQDHGIIIQSSYLMQLPAINSHSYIFHEAKTRKSKMVLSCPYYKTKMIWKMGGWGNTNAPKVA